MRLINSIKNILFGIGGQIITLILGFLSRYIFLQYLSLDYLGVSGLFSSILTMLSFAELGIGTAIVYSLYKPLAEKKQDEILALMDLFKKAYRIIAMVVFIVGMCMLPCLDFFITDRKGIQNLEIIYILFVINTAVSYLFSYNRSLITADQKAYKLVYIEYAFKFIHVFVPLIGLALTRAYILFLSLQIATTILLNICVYYKVNREYPYLKSGKKVRLSDETKKVIAKNVVALMIYKVAVVVTGGTDNILISRFFGLTVVGIYANYNLITQNMVSIVSQGINAVTASIGNLSVTESDEKKQEVFYALHFANYWIYGFASIGIFFCITPLIQVWLGDVEVFSDAVVLPVVVSFFLLGMQGSAAVFRDAQGLFWKGKLRPVMQAIINLGASILLVMLTNSVGAIFWGTVISRLLTNFWYDPYIVFKYGLKKPVKPYFIKYFIYLVVECLAGGICYVLLRNIVINSNILRLIVHIIVCTVVVNGIFWLVYHKTEEYRLLRNRIISLVSNHKN